MYGLPQARKLANDDLVAHLAEGGYHPAKYTLDLFTNKQATIQFALVVDDFGIKYTNERDPNTSSPRMTAIDSMESPLSGTTRKGNVYWAYQNIASKLYIDSNIPYLLNRNTQLILINDLNMGSQSNMPRSHPTLNSAYSIQINSSAFRKSQEPSVFTPML